MDINLVISRSVEGTSTSHAEKHRIFRQAFQEEPANAVIMSGFMTPAPGFRRRNKDLKRFRRLHPLRVEPSEFFEPEERQRLMDRYEVEEFVRIIFHSPVQQRTAIMNLNGMRMRWRHPGYKRIIVQRYYPRTFSETSTWMNHPRIHNRLAEEHELSDVAEEASEEVAQQLGTATKDLEEVSPAQ